MLGRGTRRSTGMAAAVLLSLFKGAHQSTPAGVTLRGPTGRTLHAPVLYGYEFFPPFASSTDVLDGVNTTAVVLLPHALTCHKLDRYGHDSPVVARALRRANVTSLERTTVMLSGPELATCSLETTQAVLSLAGVSMAVVSSTRLPSFAAYEHDGSGMSSLLLPWMAVASVYETDPMFRALAGDGGAEAGAGAGGGGGSAPAAAGPHGHLLDLQLRPNPIHAIVGSLGFKLFLVTPATLLHLAAWIHAMHRLSRTNDNEMSTRLVAVLIAVNIGWDFWALAVGYPIGGPGMGTVVRDLFQVTLPCGPLRSMAYVVIAFDFEEYVNAALAGRPHGNSRGVDCMRRVPYSLPHGLMFLHGAVCALPYLCVVLFDPMYSGASGRGESAFPQLLQFYFQATRFAFFAFAAHRLLKLRRMSPRHGHRRKAYAAEEERLGAEIVGPVVNMKVAAAVTCAGCLFSVAGPIFRNVIGQDSYWSAGGGGIDYVVLFFKRLGMLCDTAAATLAFACYMPCCFQKKAVQPVTELTLSEMGEEPAPAQVLSYAWQKVIAGSMRSVLAPNANESSIAFTEPPDSSDGLFRADRLMQSCNWHLDMPQPEMSKMICYVSKVVLSRKLSLADSCLIALKMDDMPVLQACLSVAPAALDAAVNLMRARLEHGQPTDILTMIDDRPAMCAALRVSEQRTAPLGSDAKSAEGLAGSVLQLACALGDVGLVDWIVRTHSPALPQFVSFQANTPDQSRSTILRVLRQIPGRAVLSTLNPDLAPTREAIEALLADVSVAARDATWLDNRVDMGTAFSPGGAHGPVCEGFAVPVAFLNNRGFFQRTR